MANSHLRGESMAKSQETNTCSLDPAEFCRLLLSRRRLVRANEISASANVVVDPLTGKRYHVDAGRLDRFLERLTG
jgi:hypothetical protein